MINALKVGRDYLFDAAKNKNRLLRYSDVTYQDDGWVKADFFLPKDFDLVYLKTEKNIYTGWYTGNSFDGLKISNDKKIIFWKRMHHE